MTKTTAHMMREMMIATTLVAASACGVVEAPDTAEIPTGEGSGDGGSGADVQTGPLTIDSIGFIDDGLRWWSSSNGPTLTGTVDGSIAKNVDVIVGSTQVAAALSGDTWSARLPAGSIGETDTLVKVRMTDEDGVTTAIEQTFAHDNDGPTLAMLPSKVRDERGDVITFTTNGPTHEHAGPEIDLAAGGCPTVYKYAYLMTSQSPAYGDELAANPLAFNFSLTDTKVASVAFRVLHSADAVARDWTDVPVTGSTVSIPLVRDGAYAVEELATYEGRFQLELRVRDWAGNETIKSGCWIHQPLAAPLHFSHAAVPTHAGALASYSLTANSPISYITREGVGAVVSEQTITQYASEPVRMTLDKSPISGQWSVEWVQGYVATSLQSVRTYCGSDGSLCQPVQAPTTTKLAPSPLTSFSSEMWLVDANNNLVASDSDGIYTIPARAPGSPPVQYRVQVRVSNIAHYGHNSTFVYGERVDGNLNYTGTAASQRTSACARTDQFGAFCTFMSTYSYIRAINRITLDLNPIATQVRVAPVGGPALVAPSHVTPGAFVSPAMTWSGGDENTL